MVLRLPVRQFFLKCLPFFPKALINQWGRQLLDCSLPCISGPLSHETMDQFLRVLESKIFAQFDLDLVTTCNLETLSLGVPRVGGI